jgi:hypothetical protein
MRLDNSSSGPSKSICNTLGGTSDPAELDDMMRVKEEPPPNHPSSASRRRAESERLEAQLAEWTAIIAQYRARAKRAEAEARVEFDRIADELQLLRNEAGAQVMLLKGSFDLDWEGSVTDLDRSWGNIRSTFRKAEAKF